MQETTHRQATVVRTSRGLSIAGTRITLYALLDYLHADWPPKLIQDLFDLSEQQMADVLAYIADHRDEVEQEYQQVLQQAEKNRRYWDAQLRERPRILQDQPASAEQEQLRAKLREWKAQLQEA